MVLAAAGISLGGDADGEGLPERRATLNAIMDLAPEPLVEWLLIEVLGNVLRPSGPSDIRGEGRASRMSIDPGTVDMGSTRALQEAFRSAPDPTVEDLVGAHRGEYVGALWLRTAGPVIARLGRDARLVRQALRPGGRRDDPVGVNLLRSGEQIVDSVPMKACVGPSRLDGRPALIIGYPVDAPFPWPRVTDELRPFGDGALIGVNVRDPRVASRGAPFLLRRIE